MSKFWGTVLIIIGILLLGFAIFAMIDIASHPLVFPGDSWTSGWRGLFWSIIIAIGGLAAIGFGASSFAPKDSTVSKFFSWDTPQGTKYATLTETVTAK